MKRIMLALEFLFTGHVSGIPVEEAISLLNKVSRHEQIVPCSENAVLRAIEDRLWAAQHPVRSSKDKFVETITGFGNNLIAGIGNFSGKAKAAVESGYAAGKAAYQSQK